MKSYNFNKVAHFRKERNADLIRRMQSGEQLTSFNSYASWYPPRPIIEKDIKAVRELYGTEPIVKNRQNQQACDETQAEKKLRPLRLA